MLPHLLQPGEQWRKNIITPEIMASSLKKDPIVGIVNQALERTQEKFIPGSVDWFARRNLQNSLSTGLEGNYPIASSIYGLTYDIASGKWMMYVVDGVNTVLTGPNRQDGHAENNNIDRLQAFFRGEIKADWMGEYKKGMNTYIDQNPLSIVDQCLLEPCNLCANAQGNTVQIMRDNINPNARLISVSQVQNGDLEKDPQSGLPRSSMAASVIGKKIKVQPRIFQEIWEGSHTYERGTLSEHHYSLLKMLGITEEELEKRIIEQPAVKFELSPEGTDQEIVTLSNQLFWGTKDRIDAFLKGK